MATDLDKAWSIKNLERAWLWTTTNTEFRFKNYFRHVYRAYSLSPNKNLADLRSRLKSTAFQPVHSTKIYVPKKSGVLRPFTLLAVEDQIVYQALVNLVADRMYPKVRHRYNKSVFGHLYAGKRSRFFYKDWKEGYSSFSRGMVDAYSSGFKYTASFDLTACFDSIDHSVLMHFLRKLNLDPEFCECLAELLKYWTAASGDSPIYHGHGIPQGPLPSGMLAEVVLKHFDENHIKAKSVIYFRYVDDIRLFAKSEKELRRRLIQLDLLSKEIGVFPQTGKIDIHEVRSIQEEIKSISNPPEPDVQNPDPDQALVRLRMTQLTARYKVVDVTRFKYVLASASPNATLAKRLLRVLETHPHLYESIFRYLSSFKTLSRVVSKECMSLLKEHDLYSAFTAALISVLRGRINSNYQNSLNKYCLSRLSNASKDQDPEVRAAASSVLLVNGRLSWARMQYNVLWKKNWWVRTEVIRFVQKDMIGEPSYESLLNRIVRDEIADVALVGAEMMVTDNIAPARPARNIHLLAQHSMRTAGLVGRISSSRCPVADFMVNVLGGALDTFNWKRFFGNNYSDMVAKASRWRGYSDTDATTWVNLTDTINDMVLDALYQHESENLGAYDLGNIGSVTNSPTGRLATRYPSLFEAVERIHNTRLESDLSHPIVRKTQRPTRWIRHREMADLKVLLRKGYVEMWGIIRF